MDTCYEYFACKKKDCPCYGVKGQIKCWETEGTQCNDPSIEVIVNVGKNKCEYCSYYKIANFIN